MYAWLGAMLTALALGAGSATVIRANEVQELKLTCPETSDPNLTRLCGLLSDRLAQNADVVPDRDGNTVITLQGRSLPRLGLAARLVVTRPGHRFVSPELTLTVMDRDDIPAAVLGRFADDLIASAALAGD